MYVSGSERDPATFGILASDPAYNAVLAARIDDTETLARVWIKPTGVPVPFEPGQYVTIGVKVGEKWLQRPYSIASSARDLAGGYELYLRLVRGGAFTPLAFSLPVGHALRVLPPKGSSPCNQMMNASTSSSHRELESHRSSQWRERSSQMVARDERSI